MSVRVDFRTILTASEKLEGNPDSAPDTTREVVHTNFNTSLSLKSDSTPAISKMAAFVQALTGGAATIDLTALTGTNGATVDGTGLKVQAIKLKSKDANENTISVEPGVANPYDMFGSDFKVTLSPGQEVTLFGNEATPDISGTDKTLDLAGTGVEELEVIVVMG